MAPRQAREEKRQQRLLRRLVELLEGDEDVLLLGLRGSLLRPQRVDWWSDVDVLLVVRDAARARFFPTLDWLAPLGAVFAAEQFTRDDRWTTRVCFDDFRRLDVVITTATQLAATIEQKGSFLPGETRPLIARSAAASEALSAPGPATAPSPPSPEQFQETAENFWFKAVVAVTKVVRGDLLIGAHLALELIQECCVVGMMIRDRETGTTHHRSGAMGNEVVARLPSLEEYAATSLLQAIEESGAIFDQLAGAWTDSYRPGSPLFEGFVARAAQALREEV